MEKNSSILLTVFATIIIIFLLGYGFFRISKLRTFQFFGGLIARVETNNKVVALTFDDSPNEYSNEVVDILNQKNIKATFYSTGQNIEKYPEETRYIVSHGHSLGNHSYSHQRFILKPLSFIDHEVQVTNQLIKNAGYQGEITFRPPNGKKLFLLPWYLKQHNINTIMWDVEPDTYVGGNSNAIVNYTLEYTHPGSIILLHPFCESTCKADREALPQIIDKLHEMGYQFLTVAELLDYN